MILDIERGSPTEHEKVNFVMRAANRTGDFKKRDRSLPIKYLNMTSNEELLIHPAKKRPAIILCANVDQYPEVVKILQTIGKKHLQEDAIFLIPCYGIQTEFDPYGFPPEMVFRIRHLLYRQFFYFPDNSEFTEGIARFDRVQVVVGRDPSTIEPSQVCLTQELLGVFLSMFIYCTTGVADEDLLALLNLARSKYSQ
jgi:hypothetical protein